MKIDPKTFQVMPSEACKVFLERLKKRDPNMTKNMLEWTEFTFMSGATALFDITTHGMTVMPDDEAEKFIDKVHDDLNQYAQRQVNKFYKPGAS